MIRETGVGRRQKAVFKKRGRDRGPERKRGKWPVNRDDERTRSVGVIKQKRGCERESRVRRVEVEEMGCSEAGNTEQRPGGCLDRCRLPLGSPRSSINRPPHNPALPTVGEICPETHGVALANRAEEGGNEGF
ncbi:unnamed protein product [Pleuronectes platessa]|uniref:Uncharacterized protein n=1 Tax=Pleuronectes platessa TaxID=8262 RepID=A0A9N7Z7Z0_PLEPL|nr:unnamed protein product [Pleuronectes platessa]